MMSAKDYDAWQKKAGLLWSALLDIERITDVMIHDGPGAVQAYYGCLSVRSIRGSDIRGLPTSFQHQVAHAKVIRKIIKEVLG